MNTPAMTGYLIITYVLLTKPKVKITGFWPSFFFCVFIDQDDVEFHKKRKRTRLISSHAWSKRIYHTTKRFDKDTCVCSPVNPRELFMLRFFYCLLPLNSIIDSASLSSSYTLHFCQRPQLESLGGMINNS